MLLSRVSVLRFSVKKVVGQPGLIVDPESFRQTGMFPGALHWFRNTQTFSDMQRHLKDFNRNKSSTQFLNQNNKLIECIEKRNFKDVETMLTEEYFRQVKNSIKNNEPLPINYNLFRSTGAKIVQARSFMDTIVRLKSIDQWYQVVVEFENGEKKEKVYHVLERFYKNKDWKFIKFNL